MRGDQNDGHNETQKQFVVADVVQVFRVLDFRMQLKVFVEVAIEGISDNEWVVFILYSLRLNFVLQISEYKITFNQYKAN